jgi:hypothetical protein
MRLIARLWFFLGTESPGFGEHAPGRLTPSREAGSFGTGVAEAE